MRPSAATISVRVEGRVVTWHVDCAIGDGLCCEFCGGLEGSMRPTGGGRSPTWRAFSTICQDVTMVDGSDSDEVLATPSGWPSGINKGATCYLGIDLSTDPNNTGAVLLADNGGQLDAWCLSVPATDEVICKWFARCTAMGIDVPLGWPSPFVQAITAHQLGSAGFPWPAHDQLDQLAWRTTDWAVIERKFKMQQLFRVAADRVGKTAMRGAAIQAQLPGGPYPRDGSRKPDAVRRLVEVYPAAALYVWNLPHKGYKTNSTTAAKKRVMITSGLVSRFTLTMRGSLQQDCHDNDNVLDALVCALIAYEACLGQTALPTASQRQDALTEGWIHLPT